MSRAETVAYSIDAAPTTERQYERRRNQETYAERHIRLLKKGTGSEQDIKIPGE